MVGLGDWRRNPARADTASATSSGPQPAARSDGGRPASGRTQAERPAGHGGGQGLTIAATEATFQADIHRYLFADQEIEVILDRFAEERHGGGVVAEITINTSKEPGAGLLHRGRVNLISTRSRSELVRTLEKRPDNGRLLAGIDFGGILEVACYRSLERWRQGDPTVDLRDVRPGERPRWLLEPFVEEAGAALLFGDGGVAKSILALTICVGASSGVAIIGSPRSEPRPALYLDWEADQHVHAERERAICAGAGLSEIPAIYYRRQVASLAESAAMLRREVAKLGVGLVIIDSMGAARGGDPESADTTIRLFNAARSLGVAWLGIDHVPKNAHDKSKPFGSTYSHNLARVTWGVERAQEAGEDQMVVSLSNHKANNGRLAKRQAFRLRFDMADRDTLAAIAFEPCDVRDVPALAERLPVKERILAVLRDGKMTTHAIADALQIGQSQTRVRLNELAKADRVARLGEEWGLQGHA